MEIRKAQAEVRQVEMQLAEMRGGTVGRHQQGLYGRAERYCQRCGKKWPCRFAQYEERATRPDQASDPSDRPENPGGFFGW